MLILLSVGLLGYAIFQTREYIFIKYMIQYSLIFFTRSNFRRPVPNKCEEAKRSNVPQHVELSS